MRLRACLAALSVGLVCSLSAHAQDAANSARLGPAVYRSDFRPNPGASADSGSRDGWESFPLSQETGYDPTIEPETRDGVSALVREAAPIQDGPFQLGFIRRMHMVAGTDSWLHLRANVPYAIGRVTIECLIFREEKEERHTATLSGGSWNTVSCPVDASPSFITAVAVAAVFPHAVTGRSERFLVEGVRLKGQAIRRIGLAAEDFFWDASRELFYRRMTVHPGDDLDIGTAMSGDSNVRWTLLGPEGKEVEHGTGRVIRYRFPSEATTGIWTLRVESSNAQTTALLLLRPQQPSGLLFDHAPPISAKLLGSIRERKAVLQKTIYPEAGMNIDRFDPHWLLAGLPSYFDATLQSSELAMLDAIEFRATGDTSARDEARRLLESIAQWRMWVHPWFPAHGYHSYYPVGIMTKYVVMAEQFLGNDLSVQDRRKLDDDLMDLSVKPIYEEYVLEDRLQFNTSNWIGNTVGGAVLAALQSDHKDAAGYALGLFVKERDHVEASYTADGSYGEGVTYQRFDLEMTTLVAEAAKRQLGTSLDSYLMPPERYLRYASFGTDGLLDYGDTHADIAPSNVFAYLAAQNRSASLNDFYFKYRDEGTAEILSRVLWEWAIKPVPTLPAPEPASTLFGQRGIVVLRDSMSPQSTVTAMRAGKNFNHNHADEGSIFYAYGGKLWLGEAGYADYYKDPSYSTFNIQAIGHNTLLVGGNAESQALPGNAVFGQAPSFTHALLGPFASLIQADLTSAYAGSMERYTRSLFFQDDGALVVIDDVVAASPQRFTQVWHPEQPVTLSVAPRNMFRMSDGHAAVEVSAFARGLLGITEHTSPLPLVDYEKAEHQSIQRPTFLEISDATPRTRETIVTLIEPYDRPREEVSAAKWETTSGASTLRMNDAGVQILDAEMPGGGRCRTILAWWRDGALLLCGMRYEDQHIDAGISADHPIDMRVLRNADGEVRVEIDAITPTNLKLRKLRSMGGTPCVGSAACRDAGANTVAIGSGHTFLSLQYAPD